MCLHCLAASEQAAALHPAGEWPLVVLLGPGEDTLNLLALKSGTICEALGRPGGVPSAKVAPPGRSPERAADLHQAGILQATLNTAVCLSVQ